MGSNGQVFSGQQRSRNPLVKDNANDTIVACRDYIEYLMASGEDLPPGLQLSHGVLYEALGELEERRLDPF